MISQTELELIKELARTQGWAEFHGIWMETWVPATAVVKLLNEYERLLGPLFVQLTLAIMQRSK